MSPAAKGSGPNTLGRWGEWKWLSALLPGLSRGLSRRVVLGPGDDAALLNLGGETWAITTDMLVEGVHFRTSWTSGEELGHKALAVNLSDLAAMGDVTPGFGVVSAGFPPQTPVSFLKGFYRGFAALARSTGFDLVGGDTVRADRITVSVTALGKVRPGNRVFRRDAFHPGDVLMVTGTLGDADAGLAIAEARRPPRTADERFLLKRFRRPAPRLDAARRLARAGVRAGLDSSDGLWRSVKILCERSGVGAAVDVERLPLSPALRRWAGPGAFRRALTGGEDYELVVGASPSTAGRLERLGWATAVGTILPRASGVGLFKGKDKREAPAGFEHFDS